MVMAVEAGIAMRLRMLDPQREVVPFAHERVVRGESSFHEPAVREGNGPLRMIAVAQGVSQLGLETPES